jgi:polyhydroxybutyrate depolymerase
MRRAGGVLLATLALVSGCGGGPPERGTDERAPLAAAAVPAEPSAGCRGEPFPSERGPRRLTVAGETRDALVDAPAAPGDRPLPVVLAFHGFRGSARRFRTWAGWSRLGRREGFVAVHPDGHAGVQLLGTTGLGWDTRPGERRDVDFVRALLDRLEAERCIDRRRIFATGMSNGGFFANLLGCALADRLAAVAPVAGALPLEGCAPARPLPILLLWGRADRIVSGATMHGARDWWVKADACGAPFADEGCDRYRGCTADVVYCEGPQAHAWPARATARIWRFFQGEPRRS